MNRETNTARVKFQAKDGETWDTMEFQVPMPTWKAFIEEAEIERVAEQVLVAHGKDVVLVFCSQGFEEPFLLLEVASDGTLFSSGDPRREADLSRINLERFSNGAPNSINTGARYPPGLLEMLNASDYLGLFAK